MKRILIYVLTVCCLCGFGTALFGAEEAQKTADESIAASIAADVKEVKTDATEVYQESKKAIIRDAKKVKEEIPKDLKEAKEEVIQKSKEIKKSVKQEFKEVKQNMSKPLTQPKTESK